MAEPSTIFGPGPAFDVSRRIALLLPIAAGAALQGEPAMASGADEVPITFVARLRARPGEADALRAVLSERQPLHHGCLYFSTAQDTKDRDVFWTSEGVALRLIDNAHPEPRALCAAAAGLAFARRSGDLYPGVCAPAPEGYADWLAAMLGAATTLGVVQVMDARFAVVQDPPDQLLPIQRIPHFDDADPAIHAVVHYLCNPPHRGTAFYRHRATGFERIAASRLPAWRQALAANSRISAPLRSRSTAWRFIRPIAFMPATLEIRGVRGIGG
eukprot:gene6454-6520_t